MMDWIVIYRAHWDYLTAEKAQSMEEYFSHELPGTSAQELADTVKALTETWGDDLRSKPPMAKDIVKAARSRRQRGKAPECRHQLRPLKCPLGRPRWADGDTNYAHTCNTCGQTIVLKGEII